MSAVMNKISLVLHLHAHMPYVLHHGDWPHGNTWLSEVVFEAYMPLLNILRKLKQEGIEARISLDISPILLEQLSHPDSPRIFKEYALRSINQAKKDLEKFSKIRDAFCNIPMAKYWHNFYQDALFCFEEIYEEAIIHGIVNAAESGQIELMTCGLTHAYLPLLSSKQSVDIHIHGAQKIHEQHFGAASHSMWLPECGFESSIQSESQSFHLDESLLKHDISMIFLDQQHNIEYDEESQKILKHCPAFLIPLFPITFAKKTSERTLKSLIRHKTACDKVWSKESGYPVHSAYLDFHKKEFNSSLRYWKVTDHKTGQEYKLPYSPIEAKQCAKEDANDYIRYLEEIALSFQSSYSSKGVICLAFDAELFGHWWFEGPDFLYHLIKGIHASELLELKFPSEVYQIEGSLNINSAEGSWGINGTDETWNNIANAWMLNCIHEAEMQFSERIVSLNAGNDVQMRILNQALRELLLMQASDWPFLITHQQAVDYAEQRFCGHRDAFKKLIAIYDEMFAGADLTKEFESIIEHLEQQDDVLKDITIEDWDYHSA
jgi:1,4-alpha-glucan branching enzyme